MIDHAVPYIEARIERPISAPTTPLPTASRIAVTKAAG
jgi:hypothetical protein